MSLIQAAIASIPFPQLPLMTKLRFASFLGQRDINVGEKGIDALVNARIIERLCDAAQCFHPFQVWPIAHLLHNVKIDLGVGIQHYGLDVAATERFVKLQVTERIKDWFERFPQNEYLIDFNERLMPMLLWLESYYLPQIRGVFRGVGTRTNKRNRRDLLRRHSLSVDKIIELRKMILGDALWHDPAEQSYLLFRSMSFSQRDKFKGNLRTAYDLYEIAELLRLYIEEVSGRLLPKEWDPLGEPDPKWVTHRYGCEPQFGNPVFMKSLVRAYGLDPSPRVLWLVEGQTEEAFIRHYTEGMDFDITNSVIIQNHTTDATMKKPTEWLKSNLEAAYKQHQFVTITFDDSNDIRRNVDKLKGEHRINLYYTLNKPDFELANFTTGQLVDIMCEWASESIESMQIPKNAKMEIISKFTNESEPNCGNLIKTFNSVFASHDLHSGIKKGEEWGKKLADHLLNMQERPLSSGSLSKIEKQIREVLFATHPAIEFNASIERIRANPITSRKTSHIHPDSLEIR